MPQNTNLNISPYYDDFDKQNNFYKVLFRPGFPVQARELTTMQSILQNQIESVGTHLFKEGAMVIPGQIGYDTNAQAVILQTNFLGTSVENYREKLVGTIITGLTTNVKAKVIYTLSSEESEKGYITLYVKYIEAGGDQNDVRTFVNNEQLVCDTEITFGTNLIEVGTPFAQLLPTNAIAIGSTSTINSGVYFIRGYFVDIPTQTIVLDQYSNYPSYRVGLEVSESIITPEDDETLNDNATGTSNYAAPGAHRFRIKASLVKKVIDDDTDKNFIELLRLNNSKVEKFVERTQYSELEKMLAVRTYDESGNYTVKDFDIRMRESLDDGLNNGVFAVGTKTQQGNSPSDTKYAVEIGPGKAYVKGFEVETLAPQYIDLDKPRDTKALQNSIIPFDMGNYLTVDTVWGSPIINGNGITENYQKIELRDQRGSSGTAAGNVIGYARTAIFEYDTGADVTASSTTYKAYIFDIQPLTLFKLSNSVTLVQGQVIRGRTSKAKAFVESDQTGSLIKVYQVYGKFIENEIIVKDGIELGSLSSQFTYELGDVKAILGRNSSNVVSFQASCVLDERRILSGTNFTVSGGTTLTGTLSNFTRDLRPGDMIYFSDSLYAQVKKISTVSSTIDNKLSSATTLTLESGGTLSNGTYATLYRKRPQLKDKQYADLLIEMPKSSIKSVSDESVIVARSFDNITVTGSNNFTLTLPSDEQFLAYDKDHYMLISLAPTAGIIIDIEDKISFNTSGTPRTSLTVSNLTGYTSVRLIASLSKNQVEKRIKTASKMNVMKLERTSIIGDVTKFGLNYGSIYGTRIEDDEISFGCSDVYKLHAVYESTNDGLPSLPKILMQDATFFKKGTLIQGKTSGAKGMVVNFSGVTLYCDFVYKNNDRFIPGETVIGTNTNDQIVEGLIDDNEGSVNNGSKDITDSFYLDSNQNGYFYDVSKLIRKPNASSPLRKIMVVYDRFTHESSGDYFNGSSYVGVDYEEIPSIGSGREIKQLRDVLDFRPSITPVLSGSGSPSDPYFVNCASLDFKDRSFLSGGASNNATVSDIPKPESDFRCDYDYYLPRIDKVFLTDQRQFQVIKGKSSESPTAPDDLQNSMLLGTLTHEAYGYNPENVIIKRENNRRFTMKDIGVIEKRLDRVEYYTSLNLLEMETNTLSIKDADGFDKFKNGFMVDDFTSLTAAGTNHPDYECSMDFTAGFLRPAHYTTNVPLEFNSTASTNIVKSVNNAIITLPYENVRFVHQPYASRVENVNPFNVFAFIGRVDLLPSSDDWIDTQRAPQRIVNVEGDFNATVERLGADQSGFAPIQWGAWQTTWTGVTNVSSGGTWFEGCFCFGAPRRILQSTNITTTTNQTRQGVRTQVVPRIDRQSLGDSVIARADIPWIRSRNIEFKIQRLKPKTRMYPFFDTTSVNVYCTPKIIEVIKNSTEDSRTNNIPFQVNETIVGSITGARLKLMSPNDGFSLSPYDGGLLPTSYASTTGVVNIDTQAMASQVNGQYYGNPIQGEVLIGQTSGARAVVKEKRLISDQSGNLTGVFFIPTPAIDANPRWGTGRRVFRFTSSSSDSRIPGDVDSAAEATYEASGILETQQETILAVRNADIVRDTVTQSQTIQSTRTEVRQVGWWDPLAQSFLVDSKGGAFITKVDVYFKTRDEKIPINCQIRTMQNGYPTTKILPFSDVTIQPKDVQLSDNASIPTTFTFPAPVYLQESQEYAFVLFTDSNEYKVWISRMGENDISNDRTISEQPYAGVLFKSQNATTWTADQYEDLKFSMYKAVFQTNIAGRAVFNNARLGIGNGQIHNLVSNPITTTKPQLKITLNSASISYTVGAEISMTDQSPAPSAIIREVVQGTGGNNGYIIVDDISGTFRSGVTGGALAVYRIVSSRSLGTLTLNAGVTGTFTVGQKITSSSGASAVVTSWDSGTRIIGMKSVTGIFGDGDTITMTVSGTVIGSGVVSTGGVALSGDDINRYAVVNPSYYNVSNKITVRHQNHCMHDPANSVVISGVVSEVADTTIDSAFHTNGITTSDGVGSDFELHINDASAFHTVINGLPLDVANPAYIKIGSEIMKYIDVSADGKILTIPSGGRAAAGTTLQDHSTDEAVECYNLDGIPLTEINTTHNGIANPTLDTYEIGTDSIATNGIVAGGYNVYATQNVGFECLTPQITQLRLPDTECLHRFNCVSGTSINDNGQTILESSFVNDGSYEDVIVNLPNIINGQKIICSQVNEDTHLNGSKSIIYEVNMVSNNANISPVIDLDRTSLITTTNRINNIPLELSNSRKASGDLNNAIYVSKFVELLNPANSLKVMFSANLHPYTDIKVMYKVVPVGSTLSPDEIGFEYFNTTGISDSSIPKTERFELHDFDYTVNSLNFTAFQIKIIMSSQNQAYVPVIKDFRVIALLDL
jgi:hypothetical protein